MKNSVETGDSNFMTMFGDHMNCLENSCLDEKLVQNESLCVRNSNSLKISDDLVTSPPIKPKSGPNFGNCKFVKLSIDNCSRFSWQHIESHFTECLSNVRSMHSGDICDFTDNSLTLFKDQIDFLLNDIQPSITLSLFENLNSINSFHLIMFKNHSQLSEDHQRNMMRTYSRLYPRTFSKAYAEIFSDSFIDIDDGNGFLGWKFDPRSEDKEISSSGEISKKPENVMRSISHGGGSGHLDCAADSIGWTYQPENKSCVNYLYNEYNEIVMDTNDYIETITDKETNESNASLPLKIVSVFSCNENSFAMEDEANGANIDKSQISIDGVTEIDPMSSYDIHPMEYNEHVKSRNESDSSLPLKIVSVFSHTDENSFMMEDEIKGGGSIDEPQILIKGVTETDHKLYYDKSRIEHKKGNESDNSLPVKIDSVFSCDENSFAKEDEISGVGIDELQISMEGVTETDCKLYCDKKRIKHNEQNTNNNESCTALPLKVESVFSYKLLNTRNNEKNTITNESNTCSYAPKNIVSINTDSSNSIKHCKPITDKAKSMKKEVSNKFLAMSNNENKKFANISDNSLTTTSKSVSSNSNNSIITGDEALISIKSNVFQKDLLEQNSSVSGDVTESGCSNTTVVTRQGIYFKNDTNENILRQLDSFKSLGIKPCYVKLERLQSTDRNLVSRDTVDKLKLSCKFCKIEFRSEVSLENHILDCHFSCHLCKEIFNSSGKMIKHVIESHTTKKQENDKISNHKKQFKCFVCDKHFLLSTCLEKHLLTHPKHISHRLLQQVKFSSCEKSCGVILKPDCIKCGINQIGPFNCKDCIQGLEIAMSHLALSNNNYRRYDCSICHESFEKFQLLEEHKLSHEQMRFWQKDDRVKNQNVNRCKENHLLNRNEEKIGESAFECAVCSKQFTKKRLVKYHIQHQHLPLIRPISNLSFALNQQFKNHKLSYPRKHFFECFTCSEGFDGRQSLRIHKALHSEMKSFQCSVCLKKFYLRDRLLKHTQTVHLKLKLFQCFECNAEFSKRSNLKHHERSHTRKKTYKCNVCNKQLKSRDDLEIHATLHPKLLQKSKCSLCNYLFNSEDEYEKHMKWHLLNSMNCSDCNRSFTRKYVLRQHILWHERKEKNNCNECGKGFLWKHSLEKHMVENHFNSNLSVCSVCDKTFSQAEGLKLHMVLHSGKRKFSAQNVAKHFYGKET